MKPLQESQVEISRILPSRWRTHIPPGEVWKNHRLQTCWFKSADWSGDTVDGRNPAPVDGIDIPVLIGFYTSQVVQDFFHQQYVIVPEVLELISLAVRIPCRPSWSESLDNWIINLLVLALNSIGDSYCLRIWNDWMTKWSAKFYMGWWFCASFPYIDNFDLSLPVWRKRWFFWQTQASTWRKNFETLKEIKIPGLAVPKLSRSQHTLQRVKSLQKCWSGTTFLLACHLWRCYVSLR